MIQFDGFFKEEKRVYYKNITENVIPIRIEIFEEYTESFCFSNDLDLDPRFFYFTYIPAPWAKMSARFYNRDTNELIEKFFFEGDKNLEEFDSESYLKKIQEKNDYSQQAGVNDVLREHFYLRKYSDIVDVEEGDIVVDIGFNYGIFSLGALYKGASRIYGFEPNQKIFNLINEIYPQTDKVKIYNLAVSDKDEILNFNEGHNTLASSIVGNVDDFKTSYKVNCVNFYNFIINYKIDRIDFLKVDCEGTEYQIFDCIPDTFFSTIKKIHVEFHFNNGPEVQNLIGKLERCGFDWQYEDGKNEKSNVGLIFAKKIKNKKNIVLISTYCDTEQKLNVLEKNIKKIKALSLDVALISPIPLPSKILELSDYVFFTKENPVLDWPIHAMYSWRDFFIGDERFRATNTYGDYGWAGLLHVKRLAEIFLNYDYDYYTFIIYDTILENKFLDIIKSGHNGIVFPSKRNNKTWAVGLHLMIFNKKILNDVIKKINLKDYLLYRDFDAFEFLYNHIVKPLNIKIADEAVEDEIYYYMGYDFLNMSDDENIKYIISSPDEYVDNLKILFYSIPENFNVKFIVNEIEIERTINNLAIIDFGITKHQVQKVLMCYNNKILDITQKILSIKNSAIKKL